MIRLTYSVNGCVEILYDTSWKKYNFQTLLNSNTENKGISVIVVRDGTNQHQLTSDIKINCKYADAMQLETGVSLYTTVCCGPMLTPYAMVCMDFTDHEEQSQRGMVGFRSGSKISVYLQHSTYRFRPIPQQIGLAG